VAPADDDAFDRLRRRVLWACRRAVRARERGAAVAGCAGQPDDATGGQVATSPKMVAASVEASSRHGRSRRGGVFTVSLLSRRTGTRPALREAGRRHRTIPRGSWSPCGPGGVRSPSGPRCSRRPLVARVRVRTVSTSGATCSTWRGHRAGERSGEALAPGTHPDILSMRDTKMNYGAEGSRLFGRRSMVRSARRL